MKVTLEKINKFAKRYNLELCEYFDHAPTFAWYNIDKPEEDDWAIVEDDFIKTVTDAPSEVDNKTWNFWFKEMTTVFLIRKFVEESVDMGIDAEEFQLFNKFMDHDKEQFNKKEYKFKPTKVYEERPLKCSECLREHTHHCTKHTGYNGCTETKQVHVGWRQEDGSVEYERY